MTDSLPPLPLVDGCLLIDNSFIELLQTCPTSLLYNRLHKRISAFEKPALSFGHAGHLVWEYRYKHCKNNTPKMSDEESQFHLLEKYFSENPPPEDDFRTLNWAAELFIRRYNEHYPIEPFNVLEDDKGQPMTELSFTIPLYDCDVPMFKVPVIYTGRIDLPVLWNSEIIVIDHKTTSMMGDNFWSDLKVSPQQLGYCWSFEQLTGKRCRGFCVNAVRSRPAPERPKGGIEAWWDENYQRQKFSIEPWQLVEWKNNLIGLVEEFFWHYSRGYFPLKKRWCCGKFGKCQYYDVDDLAPEDRLSWLNSSAFQENTWSPLKHQ